MISFKSFLLEAVDYDDMFKTFLGMNERTAEFKIFINDQIAWAKKTLKKQDRIVWYLGWVRLSLLLTYAKDAPVTAKEVKRCIKNNTVEGAQAIGGVALYNEADVLKASYAFSLGSVSHIMGDLEHFYSLKAEKIEAFVFTPLEMWNYVKRQFTKFEEEWASAGEDEILYREQPLEVDEAMAEDDYVTPIIDFGDGYYWVNLNKPYCRTEGGAMGHCGNSASYETTDTVLSFRKLIKRGKKEHWLWYPSMTFIMDENHILGEMKGRQNQKPDEKYHKYVVALLKHKEVVSSSGGEGWFIKNIRGGGYAPERNFDVTDLSEEMETDLFSVRPELMTAKMMYKKSGNTQELRDKITDLMAFNKEFKWVGEDVAVLDAHKGGLESFLEDYGNETAKNIGAIISDGGYIEVYEVTDYEKDAVKDMFSSAKIEAYLEQTYPADIEEWEDDPMEWLINQEPEFEELITRAAYRGAEMGAEEEMYSHLERNLSDINVIMEDDDDSIECYIDKDERWKDPLNIYISVRELVDLVSHPEFDNGWRFSIKVSEPYYGYSGFSEEGARDYIKEDDEGEQYEKFLA